MKPNEIREKVAALFCLTVIAIVAMVKIPEPDNIIVNIVVAIAAFITGSASRRGDGQPPLT
jgi:hypothetical protein